jgi:hypothetical protein
MTCDKDIDKHLIKESSDVIAADNCKRILKRISIVAVVTKETLTRALTRAMAIMYNSKKTWVITL